MNKIVHGVLGLGKVARDHIEGIAPLPGIEVGALCTRNEETLRRWGDALSVPERLRFTDARDLFSCGGVDSVSICTPNFLHGEHVRMAIAAGKPFAVEKPLSLSAEEARELCLLERAHPLPHMVCFSYRFMPAARYARFLIREGLLGEVRHVYAAYRQGWGSNARSPRTWRFQREKAGSGALGDLGSHLIDLVRFLVGGFLEVCADGGTFIRERPLEDGGMGAVTVDDFTQFLARLEGGVPAMVSATRFAYGWRNLQRVEVYGSKGGLVYRQDLEEGRLQSHLEISIGEADFRANCYHEVKAPMEFRCTEMEAFGRLLRGDSSGLAATLEDGLQAELVMAAAERSQKTRRWEPVEQEETA